MSKSIWWAVAPRFRAARQAARLSIHDVSLRTGIQVSSLYAYENGEHEPRVTAFLTLCNVYGIDPRALVAA